MHRYIRFILCIISVFHLFHLEACVSGCHDSSKLVTTRITPRSQGRNAVIKMVNCQDHTHLYQMGCWYATTALIPEFTQTFRPDKLARCLFGPALTDDCNKPSGSIIHIQGSNVADRRKTALLADYFYLSPDYDGVISIKPTIMNFNLHVDLFFGLDEWWEGAYVRCYGPLTYTRWDLKYCEKNNGPNTTGIPAGYYTPGTLSADLLHQSFSDFAQGRALQSTETTGDLVGAYNGSTDVTWQRGNIVLNPLRAARITPHATTEFGFADIRGELGWDFIQDDFYHLGLNLQMAIPTGNKVAATNLFGAQIGNDHWEAGIGISGHYCFWCNDTCDIQVNGWLDANITHLFTSRQSRTFDIKGNSLSRYIPIVTLGISIDDDLSGAGSTQPLAQFKNIISPLANIATQDVDVRIDFQADIIMQCSVSYYNWDWDIGYNVWLRTCEVITSLCDDKNPIFSAIDKTNQGSQAWALKGNAALFGYASAISLVSPFLQVGQAVALGVSETNATIFNGTNPNPMNTSLLNAGVDTPALAFAGGAPVQLNDSVSASPTHLSLQPTFITSVDLDYGAGTQAVSHKIYTALSYNWQGTWWAPYVGLGGFAEFGKTERSSSFLSIPTTDKCTTDCINCAVSQWGIFIRGGISFN